MQLSTAMIIRAMVLVAVVTTSDIYDGDNSIHSENSDDSTKSDNSSNSGVL